MNRNKRRIVFIDGYNCLPGWVTKVRSLAFPCNHFLSVCMFMYKCHLMLISVNTVDSTCTFILHGARVQGNFYYLYGNSRGLPQLQIWITIAYLSCWMSICTCQGTNLVYSSLIPRPLPDFISQPWRKVGRRPGNITTLWTGNGGLG